MQGGQSDTADNLTPSCNIGQFDTINTKEDNLTLGQIDTSDSLTPLKQRGQFATVENLTPS